MADKEKIKNYLLCADKYRESVAGLFKDWAYLMMSVAATFISDEFLIAVVFFGGAFSYSVVREISSRKAYFYSGKELDNACMIREHIKTGTIKNGR